MSYSELVATAIAFLALVVSSVALHRAGRANKIAEEANELTQARPPWPRSSWSRRKRAAIERACRWSWLSARPWVPIADR